MTTTAMASSGSTSLEDLVGRLMDALPWEKLPEQVSSLVRTVHESRRLRKLGDLDGALAMFAGAGTSKTTRDEGRWAHSEWLGLVRRRFGEAGVMVYSPIMGRAAALVPETDGTLEVVSVLGMEWQPGKVVSRHSLRGLRPLRGGSPWP